MAARGNLGLPIEEGETGESIGSMGEASLCSTGEWGVPSGVIREDSDSLRCIEYGVDSVEQGRMPKEGEQGRDVEFRSEHLRNRLRVTLMQAGDKHEVMC
jgi:hypothetical protein